MYSRRILALPLQTLASGHSLSSTSGPGQRPSSSPETGRPESRSKHARKRLWIETGFLPPPTSESCGDAESRQGEHCVHSDHSLRTTEREEGEAGQKRDGIIRPGALYVADRSALIPSHSLVSHCNAPSWQRLQNRDDIRRRAGKHRGTDKNGRSLTRYCSLW